MPILCEKPSFAHSKLFYLANLPGRDGICGGCPAWTRKNTQLLSGKVIRFDRCHGPKYRCVEVWKPQASIIRLSAVTKPKDQAILVEPSFALQGPSVHGASVHGDPQFMEARQFYWKLRHVSDSTAMDNKWLVKAAKHRSVSNRTFALHTRFNLSILKLLRPKCLDASSQQNGFKSRK